MKNQGLVINDELYSTFSSMKSRCKFKSSPNYIYYGAKGVKVCDEWSHDFYAFKKWSIENGYKKGLSLDRIDFNGNYSPENCRWVTRNEQAHNKSSNVVIEYMGKTMDVTQWCEHLGLNRATIFTRLARGWTIERTFSTPTGKRRTA